MRWIDKYEINRVFCCHPIMSSHSGENGPHNCSFRSVWCASPHISAGSARPFVFDSFINRCVRLEQALIRGGIVQDIRAGDVVLSVSTGIKWHSESESEQGRIKLLIPQLFSFFPHVLLRYILQGRTPHVTTC